MPTWKHWRRARTTRNDTLAGGGRHADRSNIAIVRVPHCRGGDSRKFGWQNPVISDARSRSAQRQARYRSRQKKAGFTEIALFVPPHAAPDLQLAAEALRQAPHLEIGPLRDPISGKLVSVKSVLRRPRRDAP